MRSPKPKRSLPKTRSRAAQVRSSPLSQTSEYAMRALAYLATLPPAVAARAAQIADATGVPSHYLSKVLRKLVAAELLAARKGHGGGFSLARPAAKIRFLDVLDALGEAPTDKRCAFGWGNCDVQNPCPLHPLWSRLNEAVIGWAERSTFADIEACSRPLSLRRRRGK